VSRALGVARAVGVIAGLALTTAVLFPAQWVLLKRDSRHAGVPPWWWHRIAVRLLGLRVAVVGLPAPERPLLIAANHVSWLDIVVLGSLMPLSFVAKAEVASWPVFGFLARMQRTVFVDRTRRTDTRVVADRIAARLRRGDPMVLFAEGTSSNGGEVLPFRSALLGAARQALTGDGLPAMVQPVSLVYTRRNGLPLGRRGRPAIAWYGDMEIAGHLWGVLTDGAIDAVVSFGAPIPYDEEADRKRVAAAAERAVREMTSAALAGRPQPPVEPPAA
jgi:1-acyl-sn-glycerol-3-phosphate acyltransferase